MPLRLLDSPTAGVDVGRSRSGQLRLQATEPSTAGDAGRVRFWRPLPRKVVDVVCGEGSAAEVDFHAHEALQVVLATSPFVVVGGAGRRTVVRPGAVHITSPLELRALRSLDGAPFDMRIILVSPAALARRSAGFTGSVGGRQAGRPVLSRPAAAPTPDAAPAFAELLVDDGGVYDELTDLFDALRRPLVALDCEPRLIDCLERLVALGAEPPPALPRASARPSNGVVRARDYLHARAVESVTLDDVAKVAGLSKFYLLRAFYRAYGLTPHAYQMQLRLARARRLLAEGRPLSHVTYDAGFADQSHLTRRFASFYGLTPARYARQLATPHAAPRDLSASAFRTATPPSAA